ncbi:MAG: phnA protein [Myxococcota bacterium]
MKRKRPKQRPQVGALGKQLTRRSRGKCELCESNVEVRPYELPPFPEEPDPERTLMACGRCREWLEREQVDPIQAHFLSSAVWAELAPVRLAAARLLLACDDLNDPWLLDALEAANVDPETGEFAAAAPAEP